MKYLFTKRTRVISLDLETENSIIDFEKNGLQIFLFCQNLKDLGISFYRTGQMYIGGLGLKGKISLFQPKIPKYQEEANKRFLNYTMNYDLIERKGYKCSLNENEI